MALACDRLRGVGKKPDTAKGKHETAHLMIVQTFAKRSDANNGHQDQVRHAGQGSALSKPLRQHVCVDQIT